MDSALRRTPVSSEIPNGAGGVLLEVIHAIKLRGVGSSISQNLNYYFQLLIMIVVINMQRIDTVMTTRIIWLIIVNDS